MEQFPTLCCAPPQTYEKFVSRRGWLLELTVLESVNHLRCEGTRRGSGMVRLQLEKMAAVSTYVDTHTGSDRP